LGSPATAFGGTASVPPYGVTIRRMDAPTESRLIRPALDSDAEPMRVVLNEIIRIGGTTAITSELSVDEMGEWFISGADVVSCFLAINANGEILGFQSLSRYGDLQEGWVDIATFASRSRQKSGVGGALFAHTRAAAAQYGFTTINASIRVDNTGGLAYYGKMGFVTYRVEDGDPRLQGRTFNRVHKRYDI